MDQEGFVAMVNNGSSMPSIWWFITRMLFWSAGHTFVMVERERERERESTQECWLCSEQPNMTCWIFASQQCILCQLVKNYRLLLVVVESFMFACKYASMSPETCQNGLAIRILIAMTSDRNPARWTKSSISRLKIM